MAVPPHKLVTLAKSFLGKTSVFSYYRDTYVELRRASRSDGGVFDRISGVMGSTKFGRVLSCCLFGYGPHRAGGEDSRQPGSDSRPPGKGFPK